MNPNILIQCPTRSVGWRLERVMEMMRHRPQPLLPRRTDDHNIRVYRRVLLELAAGGEDADRRDAVFSQYPAVCQAHMLHYSADIESRQILEARLLTTETFDAIAARLGTEPATVKYYEQIFFNVRDRFEHRDWIRKVIRGPAIAGRGIKNTRSSRARRGYVLRLFAYNGGSLALDAVINGLATTIVPPRAQDLEEWFKNSLDQLVRTTATTAATTLEMNQKNAMQIIKLAQRASAAAVKTGAESPNTQYEAIMENVLATINGPLRAVSGGSENNPNRNCRTN
jgi:hypothetical protein